MLLLASLARIAHPLLHLCSPNFCRLQVKRYLNFGRPYQNHNGGHIFFGKDGLLYYTSGDGGAWGDPFNMAQQMDTFLGKILRIDVNGPATPGRTYGIPPSNPFVARKGAAGEIYALGLRNPWRCDQDPVTGTILCGDVGQVRGRPRLCS